MRYYKSGTQYIGSLSPVDGMTEITQEEFESHMAEVQKRIEEAEANATPEPTTEERISTLETIETQQDESITEIFEALFGAESEAES